MLIASSRHWARYRLVYRALFFSVLLLGIYLGLPPAPPPVPSESSRIHSAYHAGVLLVSTLLSYPAFPRWGRWWRAGFMFAVGLAVEYVQSFHSTRSPDIHDIYANTVGVGIGMLMVVLLGAAIDRAWAKNRN